MTREEKEEFRNTMTRAIRTAGVVKMSDDEFRAAIGNPGAEIILDAYALSRPGALFEFHGPKQLPKENKPCM